MSAAAELKELTGNARMAQVENRVPGFRVIAGPYDIQHKDACISQVEKRRCAKVKREMLGSGIECKVVLLKDGAWVLRSEKGWKQAEDSLGKSLDKPEGVLTCPLCGMGFGRLQGLKVHRCPKLPLIHWPSGVYHARLSLEQIAEARLAADAAKVK